MAKIQQPKKLRAEDFQGENQQFVQQFAYIFNDLADSFYFSLIKSLDFENMNRDLVQVNVNIGSSGQVTNLPQIKYNLKNAPKGVSCVRAINQTNPTIFPTQSPFVSWGLLNNGNMQILNVTGLQDNSQYVLTLEIIG